MKKDLQKVFQNSINKELKNNNKIYYSNIKDEEIKNNKKEKNINRTINNIFKSINYVYKANVLIKTKDKDIKTKIIGRNKNYIITLDNKTIPIKDIVDIVKM